MNMIAVACICGTIAAIDAPLLQRASSVVPTSPNINMTLAVNLVPQLPGYYSGQTSYDDLGDGTGIQSQGADPNPDFYPVMISLLNNATIPAIASGCSGDCAVTVRGPMLGVWNCTETIRYVNYTQKLAGNLTGAEQQKSLELANRTGFLTEVRMSADSADRKFLRVTTGISDQNAVDTCGGIFTRKRCLLASAIGDYDLIVRDNQTSFVGGVAQPRFVAWSNNTGMNNETSSQYHLSTESGIQLQSNYNSTVAGLAYAGSIRYDTQVVYMPIDWPYHPNIIGIKSWMLSHTVDYVAFNRGNACIPAVVDPFDDLMAGINELAFRIGVHTARPEFREELLSQRFTPLDPAAEVAYATSGVLVSSINVFKVDYLFFFGVALVQLVCTLVIMYTFYGWWRLGRAVSFSPLELARAFNAPMLSHLVSNTAADEMAKEVGQHRMRYGAIGPIDTHRGR